MSDFRKLTTIEGIKCVVNFDAIAYILARSDNSSAIFFTGDDESFLVTGAIEVVCENHGND